MHDEMYKIQCRHLNTLYEPIQFKYLKQIRVSHAMFKVTVFFYFGPCLRAFSSLEG